MDCQDILVLIPARFAASRFPGKLLANIRGISLIRRVYNNCAKTGFRTYVVTDNDQIADHVKSFGGEVCRVNDQVESGTERIHLAYSRFFSHQNYKLVINVQGDEPLLLAEELQRVANYHLNSGYDIVTLVRKMEGFGHEFQDPNRVKVAFSESTGQCHYFSRAVVPFPRDRANGKINSNFLENWFLHIGVYSYTTESLIRFSHAPQSHYELVEKLEQLRALEEGLKIGAITTNQILMGVDTPEDIKTIEGVLSGN